MKNYQKLTIVLGVICTISGLLLIMCSADIAFNKIKVISNMQGGSIDKEQIDLYLYGTVYNIRIISLFLMAYGLISIIIVQIKLIFRK